MSMRLLDPRKVRPGRGRVPLGGRARPLIQLPAGTCDCATQVEARRERRESLIVWVRALWRMVLTGGICSLVGAAVIVLAFPTPTPTPTLAPAPVVVEEPRPDLQLPPGENLERGQQRIVRTTDQIHAEQGGNSEPILYDTPRVAAPGQVLMQLTNVRAWHPTEGFGPLTTGTQRLRVELVDALNGDVLGVATTERVDGENSEPVLIATLNEPHAFYLRVAAEVRGESTCERCEPGEPWHYRPLWNSWWALLTYDKPLW